MKDFPFWHNALKATKTQLALNTLGADLAAFQKQTDFLNQEIKLTEPQLKTLRELFSSRRCASSAVFGEPLV
jgi:hypothetical protein